MKHDALRRKPDAFPSTLALAFHISNQWNEGNTPAHTPAPAPVGVNAAYVTEEVHVTMAKDTEKKARNLTGIPITKYTDYKILSWNTGTSSVMCSQKGPRT